MANQTLVSLAILKANSDSGMDVYENFVPLLTECIRLRPNEIVSVPEIKLEMINQFCINIPQHVIDTILIRLRNRGLIEIDKKDGIVKRTRKLKEDDNFSKVRREAVRHHELALQDLVNYCKERLSTEWTIEQAEIAVDVNLFL